MASHRSLESTLNPRVPHELSSLNICQPARKASGRLPPSPPGSFLLPVSTGQPRQQVQATPGSQPHARAARASQHPHSLWPDRCHPLFWLVQNFTLFGLASASSSTWKSSSASPLVTNEGRGTEPPPCEIWPPGRWRETLGFTCTDLSLTPANPAPSPQLTPLSPPASQALSGL